MGVASWLLILSGPLVGPGRPGLLLRRAADCVLRVCCSWGWLVAVVGIGNTPAAGGLLWSCGRGGLVGGGCPCVLGVCGGGMLSGFWGSAPWLPDLCFCCLFVGGWGWVWVGWL